MEITLPKRKLTVRMDRELFIARAEKTTNDGGGGTVTHLRIESFCLKSYVAAAEGPDPFVLVAATNLFFAESCAHMAWEGPEERWGDRQLIVETNTTSAAMQADRMVRADMERAQKEGEGA